MNDIEDRFITELPESYEGNSGINFDEYKLLQNLEVAFDYDPLNGYSATPVGIQTLVRGEGGSLDSACGDLLENLLKEFESYDVPGKVLAGTAEAERDSLRQYFVKVE